MKRIILIPLILASFSFAQNDLADIPTNKAAGSDSLYAWEFNRVVLYLQNIADSLAAIYTAIPLADATIANNITLTNLSQVQDASEAVSDIAGAMVSSNTETGITVTYQDADNTIDFVVSTPSNVSDGDKGDISVSSGSWTLDADVIAAAEMADADHGDVAWSSGVATVQAVSGANSVDSDAYVDGSIDEAHLNITNAGTDNYVLTYNAAGGNFSWAEDATGGTFSAMPDSMLAYGFAHGTGDTTELDEPLKIVAGGSIVGAATMTGLERVEADTIESAGVWKHGTDIITATEFGYLASPTSNIQTQLNAKADDVNEMRFAVQIDSSCIIAADTFFVGFNHQSFTVDSVVALCDGPTPNLTFQIIHSGSTNLFSSAQTVDAAAENYTTFADGTLAAKNSIRVVIAAVTTKPKTLFIGLIGK